MPGKDVFNTVEKEFGVEGSTHKAHFKQEIEDAKKDSEKFKAEMKVKNTKAFINKSIDEINKLEAEQVELKEKKEKYKKQIDELRIENSKHKKTIMNSNIYTGGISNSIENKIVEHSLWDNAVYNVKKDSEKINDCYEIFRSTGRPNTSNAYMDMLGAIVKLQTAYNKTNIGKIAYNHNDSKDKLITQLNNTLKFVDEYILKKTGEGYPSKWRIRGIGNTRLAAAQSMAESIRNMIKHINKVPKYEDAKREEFIEEQNDKLIDRDEIINDSQIIIDENNSKLKGLGQKLDACEKSIENNKTKIRELKDGIETANLIGDTGLSLKNIIDRYSKMQSTARKNATKELKTHKEEQKIQKEQRKKQKEQEEVWKKEDDTLKKLKEEYETYEIYEKRSTATRRENKILSNELDNIRKEINEFNSLKYDAPEIAKGLDDKIAQFYRFCDRAMKQYESSSMGEFTTVADKLNALNDKFMEMDKKGLYYSKLPKEDRKAMRDSMEKAYDAVINYKKTLNPKKRVDRYQIDLMNKINDCIKDMSIDMTIYHNKMVQIKKGRDDIMKKGRRESEIEQKIKDNEILIKKSVAFVNEYKVSHIKTGEQIKELEAKIKNRKLSGSNMNKSSAKAHTM